MFSPLSLPTGIFALIAALLVSCAPPVGDHPVVDTSTGAKTATVTSQNALPSGTQTGGATGTGVGTQSANPVGNTTTGSFTFTGTVPATQTSTLTSTGTGTGTVPGSAPSFAKTVAPLLSAKCSRCHPNLLFALDYNSAVMHAASGSFLKGHQGANWSASEQQIIQAWVSGGKAP